MSKTVLINSEIQAQQYVYGEPFPGLLYETLAVKTKSGTIGPHAIILASGFYVVVFPGEWMQVKENNCIGHIPTQYEYPK